ncbi:MAG: tRNA (guanosine(46)-N7)-methyltransferase TrmB [Bacteroidetes bacterium]|nr:MAG: tRNA (guanosine(46)-N7)-methyltransferase TrmB [Bacteroidota bacterium]
MIEPGKRDIKSYVLRVGRLSKLQQRAVETLSDLFCIPFGINILDFEAVFGNKNPVIMEIGFGMGHATIEIAEKNRNKNYIAIEVHTPGVGKVLSEIEKRKLSNLRIIQYDAVDVIRNMIPLAGLEGVHIFFPDPWPKKKHHKRRLIQNGFIKELVLLIKKGGYIYIATDWEDYAQEILPVLGEFNELINPYKGFAEGIKWRPNTSFEKKGLAKNHIIRDIWVELK